MPDGSTGMDAMVPPGDAGPDAAASDGGAGRRDAGPLPDSGPPLLFDAGPLTDAGLCRFAMGTPCGADGGCPAGSVCLDNGCGARVCYRAGSPCGSAADCPSGSACSAGVCTRASGCGDSRDCPAGYSCDRGTCVDRRISCGVRVDCPHGFLCDASGEGIPFCIRAYTRCDSRSGCPLFGHCRDVTGTGTKICHWSGGLQCRTNADCPAAGEVCGVDPERVDGFCRAFGPCASDADCASGYACLDLWGDGVRECASTGGSCATTADCPSPAICASPAEGGPPRCIARPL